jgi:hypothetical protein
MLYCSAVQSETSFASGLWPKAELGSTYGIGLGVFYSVPWNADKTRVDKVRYWTARLFRGIDLCRSEPAEEAGSMEEADLVMRIPVTTY